jgi:hypothetical protein
MLHRLFYKGRNDRKPCPTNKLLMTGRPQECNKQISCQTGQDTIYIASRTSCHMRQDDIFISFHLSDLQTCIPHYTNHLYIVHATVCYISINKLFSVKHNYFTYSYS